MKVAILGTRGIPANYGGFETFAEECSAGLAARGHQVTVYGRSRYIPRRLKAHRGARLVVLPTLPFKYTDTVVHTFLSVLHSLFQRYDAVLICNAANSVFAWLPRLFGTPVAVNVDGIERKRRKWSLLGKAYYRLGEYLSTLLPNAVVADARVIERYYRDRYGAEPVFIPYGAAVEKPEGKDALEKLRIAPGEYFLYVSRLEPENNAHLVIRAFEKVRTSKRLVVVGDAPYAARYIRRLRQTRDPRILFPGAVYGSGYRQLQANAFCYIQATDVGGTHPALIEAMGQGNIVVANATPENQEVVGDAGVLYAKNDVGALQQRLQDIADNPDKYEGFKSAASSRIRTHYSWDGVVERYERLFLKMVQS
ncbi:MAG: glycosyltransferase [Acidobacteria bacterium]|nr:glycosyltransferase [Acidobacteriota bacterium]